MGDVFLFWGIWLDHPLKLLANNGDERAVFAAEARGMNAVEFDGVLGVVALIDPNVELGGEKAAFFTDRAEINPGLYISIQNGFLG